MQGPTKAKHDTLRGERRSALRKALTEPTLLEMSGRPGNRALSTAEARELLKRDGARNLQCVSLVGRSAVELMKVLNANAHLLLR